MVFAKNDSNFCWWDWNCSGGSDSFLKHRRSEFETCQVEEGTATAPSVLNKRCIIQVVISTAASSGHPSPKKVVVNSPRILYEARQMVNSTRKSSSV